mmetsp:Transcript_6215/g.10106  ORF Transcript_6215/g.10106 Transcript_6215/m.10106 type:complete len:162 (+) Transcript_6215:920-1405(+)|eukprot:CAMPEP_0170483702 /NCGR_PEP_ID=MMETSP0208-20121228/3333_1 /TAXON_ID=197538 /ORGANISM="Strombidium inclinatum, Strain S3" /LENGTH=161 /DNA_ID=CAMNT_0010756839 /DNA_START=864 /DNA_END=1349 /DNA_ORIENTATION=+
MRAKYYELLDKQRSKSVQYEVLKSVISIYKDDEIGPQDLDVYGHALNKLTTEFVDHQDPNIRFLGIQLLQDTMDEKTKHVFGPKIFKKFISEKEQSILNLLISIMKSTVDILNYKAVLGSLFDKFKKQQNLLAINSILEIEEEFIFLLDSEPNREEAYSLF